MAYVWQADAIATNQDSTLGVLLLSECHLGNNGAQALAQASLSMFETFLFQFESSQVKPILVFSLQAIESNPNLTTVDCYGNDEVTPEVMASINKAVKENQKKKVAGTAASTKASAKASASAEESASATSQDNVKEKDGDGEGGAAEEQYSEDEQ